MKRLTFLSAVIIAVVLAGAFVQSTFTNPSGLTSGFMPGTPDIQSMSVLTFGPDGVLFIGDSKGGAVFAIDLNDQARSNNAEPPKISDIEGEIASLLGTTVNQVLIHDMAVNPISQNIYLAVSRGRSQWNSKWQLPNDLDDARILLRITPEGDIDEASLQSVKYAKASLPNPVDESKEHRWKKGLSLRVDTITDIAYSDGKVFVAGLSNEEFASTMWQIPFPFKDHISATTIEIFHGAHGKYETHAPIRTFLPYDFDNQLHLLAAYLCTPLVTLPVADLKNGQHLKGRTVAEFGSGNYPLDMILYKKGEDDFILIANSNLPFMIVDPKDVESYDGSITEEVEGYLAGVKYEPRAGTGIQQLDNFNSEYVLALRRLPGGTMDLEPFSIQRF
ncbi:hypothetical protein GWO43_17040 [candidate division KSB1 bacterium]|nr:hypothetical protein [candidate division KSB1 bacterium]NIR69169.1 hypothetical protein [candidate division KSB1 bacterium]NIS25680.1 hypothetical protein [candidate division KSB1 bacterium]NIT72548.1 hypothetical protein [candidate division KSB1 bacterium]NIU26357.1 hypothetical protein [candidate division KSB1 bacterium]